MGKAELPRRDDLPAIGVSQLRALHTITPSMTSVEIAFGELKRTVRVTHRLFPPRGPEGRRGSWSFFLCPSCSRRVRTLRLYDGRVVCSHCDGLLNRAQMEGRRTQERIDRLRERLYGPNPAKLRRRALELSLKRALIVERRKRLGLDP
jgi:hypothetical protein